MDFVEVKNKKGTSNKLPPTGYDSWLDFWEKKKGFKASTCEVLLCKNTAKVGGHIIKAGEGGKEYIAPLCYECNNKPDNEVFKIYENDLVPVK
ncbi:hypothetical protein P3G55_23310 [Leptospira sp. 96542]|nr:hypothetical protein [Leptospira sp. 96542]